MSRHFEPACLDAANVKETLRTAGITISSAEITVERRGERALAALPDGRLAWFATTTEAARRLRTEDRFLALVSRRCSFRVPKVLDSGEGWSVRSKVAGVVDPDGFAARLKSDPRLISSVASTLGELLAEQHTLITEADVAGWLPQAPAWPPARPETEARLPAVPIEPDLRSRIDRLLETYDDGGAGPQDRVPIHGDFGFHNMAFSPATGQIVGIFDYGEAAWADRHLDVRYLTFGAVQDTLLDETIRAYRAATGVALDRNRALLCNAAAAVGHLADRAGFGEDEVVGGRTLAGDLRWTRWALRRAGF